MSVYIKGMELPKSCAGCRFAIAHYSYARCLAILDNINYVRGQRDSRCPLIPVPDHGDLIERDAIYDSFKKNPYSKDDLFMSVGLAAKTMRTVNSMFALFRKTLQDAPTIIPAEKEDGE